MSYVRVHTYRVDPAQLDELLDCRAKLIAAIGSANSHLAETQLIRLDDGSYIDMWRWDSAERLRAALSAAAAFPEVRATLSLTLGPTAQNGEIVDRSQP